MANSKDGQVHKDKYIDTSTKILSQEGLVTKNTHVKYQSSSTHSSKVISKVKVFKK